MSTTRRQMRFDPPCLDFEKMGAAIFCLYNISIHYLKGGIPYPYQSTKIKTIVLLRNTSFKKTVVCYAYYIYRVCYAHSAMRS